MWAVMKEAAAVRYFVRQVMFVENGTMQQDILTLAYDAKRCLVVPWIGEMRLFHKTYMFVVGNSLLKGKQKRP